MNHKSILASAAATVLLSLSLLGAVPDANTTYVPNITVGTNLVISGITTNRALYVAPSGAVGPAFGVVSNANGTIDIVASGKVTNSWERWSYKTTNQVVNDSTVFVNDTQLALPIEASTTWAYDFTLFGTSSTATPDFKFSFTGPVGITVVTFFGADLQSSAGGTPVYGSFSASGIGILTAAVFRGVKGRLVVENGVNAGTIQLVWAQNTQTAEDTTVRAGSYLRGIRLK